MLRLHHVTEDRDSQHPRTEISGDDEHGDRKNNRCAHFNSWNGAI